MNIFRISFLKTLRFNLHYFGLTGFYFPVLLARNVELNKLQGSVILRGVKPFTVKIGFGNVNIFSDKYERSTWVNNGTIIFNGKCNLGKGVKISCSIDAKIEFGSNFVNTARMTLVCVKSVIFEDDCLVSWNVTIMDGDTHKIVSSDDVATNESKPILIKKKVWIGCEVLILKGVIIEHDCVIAAKSIITKNCTIPNTVYGNFNKQLHDNITWHV